VRRRSRRSSSRSKGSRGGFFFWFLTCAGLATLAWLFWGHLLPHPNSPAVATPKQSPEPAQRAASDQKTQGSPPPLAVPPAERRTTDFPLIGPAHPNSARSHPSATESPVPAPPPEVPKPPPGAVLEAQLALVRHGISPGSIDGVSGSQTRSALRAFQFQQGLPQTGQLDGPTRALLQSPEPLQRQYFVSPEDLARLTPVGKTWLAKSQQSRLDYESMLELVSEKFQSHPTLIRKWNPSLQWTNVTVGTSILVPNLELPSVRSKAAFVRIRLADKTLQAFDRNTNLLAHFPCSIARRVEKRPVGSLLVEVVAENPNYRFDPAMYPDSAEARRLGRALMIPPGPNNPVGTAWIGLNKPGYGIHGTPRPEEVGRTESLGCFRLANWNAEFLLQLVWVGMPVMVEP
jgi:lipoprotein-anchoring transpeptidase ErfK/SrfK